ncbi:uncharacterized protein LY89DRAFT_542018, partial [Mollisia scopiformis]
QTIHQFPDPTWVENIAIRPNGQILVDLVTTPDMYLLDPHPNSTATLIHSFSSDHAVLGLTETTPDMFHLIASNFTLTPPTIANGTDSIWTVDLTSYDHKTNTGAKIHQVVLIPESDLLNGLSTLSPEKGLIVAADSFKGVIWLINVNTGAYSILFQDPALAPTSPEPSGLSVNGIRVLPPSAHNNDTAWIYFDNTAKATFNRVPISLSALKATAAVQQLASNISIDDFALDPERGYAYVAAGAINQVFRIPLEGGTPEYVFGGLNSTVIPNPTSVAVAGEGRIYVTTTGGIESPVNGTYREGGKVVSYEL